MPARSFAAYAAHELRTPITLQLALAESALANPDADEAVWRAMAEGVVASCEQQRRLIEALLDLARSQHGVARPELVDLGGIVAHALHSYDVGDLESVVMLEPAVATGDRDLLQRLVANLVSNAVRHNIPRGRIEVSTGTDSGRASLFVANTGPRIRARELRRLFQPFERLESRPRRCADGTGLGLAIVESIANAHRAVVTAHAPPLGGLEIDVRFPAVVCATSWLTPAPSSSQIVLTSRSTQ